MLARSKIVDALIIELKKINGSNPYNINMYKNVKKGLIFWDEIDDFPYMCVNASDETREYLPSNFKWGFLTINLKIYVKDEDPEDQLEKALEDIEYVVDNNCDLVYDSESNSKIEDMRIVSIVTDEGLLNPLGVGDILLQIRYEV